MAYTIHPSLNEAADDETPERLIRSCRQIKADYQDNPIIGVTQVARLADIAAERLQAVLDADAPDSHMAEEWRGTEAYLRGTVEMGLKAIARMEAA